MAKDSDKLRVLTRRKQELDHAIRHGYPAAAINVRAEKLRAAAFAVLKKYRDLFAHWEALQARWESLTADEIIELSAGWGTRATLRDVRLAARAEVAGGRTLIRLSESSDNTPPALER